MMGLIRLAFALVIVIAVPVRAAADFLDGVEDLPLMAGLQEVEEAGLVFDTPEGRVVEARARGRVAAGAVRQFYTETLANLGWEADTAGAGEMAFRRNGERLVVRIASAGGETDVSFTITPSP